MSSGILAGGTLPDGTAYVVRRAESDEDREACFLVRKEVFVQEQGVPEDLEYDALDAGAAHVLALTADGTPLGAGRLLHGEAAWEPTGHTPGAGSLGRLAVRAAARGGGAGVALVTGIERLAAGLGLTSVDLHAQTHALGFYERLGYVAYGGTYREAGIEHRAMRKTV
ncbi:GNAT family N-acetyltransferase [Streptomyces sp. P6-2-1]|uniref:GNAT family N-acetyltransferase n=1 Tax=unclassified Streptomyces TaxID=2593676 RepID=UPI003D365234